ncbi:MAG: hypothetical protein M1368_05500, partial [Thaumarchaeota archaeon]|nr:hypothetical protein [Nitrososphaerota archaeon]
TTIPFHKEVMRDPRFSRGEMDTGFIESSGVIGNISKSQIPSDAEYAIASMLLLRDQFASRKVESTPMERPPWLDKKMGRFVDAL